MGRLLMEPGSALLVLAVAAFLLRFLVVYIPVIGGLLAFVLWFAVVFGLVGGIYLTVTSRRNRA
ncbi:MAG: hypothetical protein R2761_00060 [Acidimicrobiales bacterium]